MKGTGSRKGRYQCIRHRGNGINRSETKNSRVLSGSQNCVWTLPDIDLTIFFSWSSRDLKTLVLAEEWGSVGCSFSWNAHWSRGQLYDTNSSCPLMCTRTVLHPSSLGEDSAVLSSASPQEQAEGLPLWVTWSKPACLGHMMEQCLCVCTSPVLVLCTPSCNSWVGFGFFFLQKPLERPGFLSCFFIFRGFSDCCILKKKPE